MVPYKTIAMESGENHHGFKTFVQSMSGYVKLCLGMLSGDALIAYFIVQGMSGYVKLCLGMLSGDALIAYFIVRPFDIFLYFI